jgi:hypothetical protein
VTGRRIMILIGLAALLYVYGSALLGGTYYASAIPIPAAWVSLFANRLSGVLAWMIVVQTLAVLVISIPFAFVVARFGGRYAPVVALAMTLVLFVVFFPSSFFTQFGILPLRTKIVTGFEQVKLILVLPSLVWLIRRLPSNNRWRGP